MVGRKLGVLERCICEDGDKRWKQFFCEDGDKKWKIFFVKTKMKDGTKVEEKQVGVF